jgi:sigma-E factor negative regulatory protein RseC
MTESDGVVVRVEGEYAWIRAVGAGNACGGCSRQEGCRVGGGSILDGVMGQKARLLRLPNLIQARPGDAVVVRVADGVVLRAAWLAYGVPLLLAMLGATLFLAVTDSEPVAAMGALLGLAGGFQVMHRRGFEGSQAEPILSFSFKRELSPPFLHEV